MLTHMKFFQNHSLAFRKRWQGGPHITTKLKPDFLNSRIIQFSDAELRAFDKHPVISTRDWAKHPRFHVSLNYMLLVACAVDQNDNGVGLVTACTQGPKCACRTMEYLG